MKFENVKSKAIDLKNKTKNQHRKREPTIDFSENPNTEVLKMSKYDMSELMNKFEEFSDVWNDFPTVKNPREKPKRWFGDYDQLQLGNEVEDCRRVTKNTANKSFQKNKQNFQVTREKIQEVNKASFKTAEAQEEHEKFKCPVKTVIEIETLKKCNAEESHINNTTENHQNQSVKYNSNAADLKRQKAVQEQRQLHVDQKNIIKQALRSMDGKQLNKKIIFSDGNERQDYQQTNDAGLEGKSLGHHKLFDDDDDSEPEAKLTLNHQFEGKKGQKLLELQSKFASDSRFTLDTRFYESGSEDGENDVPGDSNETDEKQKQLAILESIVQQEIKPSSEIRKTQAKRIEDTLLLRFDPTREDHIKFIVKPKVPSEDEEGIKKKKKNKYSTEEIQNVQENKTQVSSEKFYTVKEDLKEVLKKNTGTEFSLLKLFGSKETDDHNQNTGQSQSVQKLKHGPRNPFKYDSSESEPEEKTQDTVKEKEPKNLVRHPTASVKTTFFFTENDSRLQEALEFLKGPEEVENKEEYAEKRKLLKHFIRNKFKNNNRKKGLFKKKLGGVKKKIFQNKKGKRN